MLAEEPLLLLLPRAPLPFPSLRPRPLAPEEQEAETLLPTTTTSLSPLSSPRRPRPNRYRTRRGWGSSPP